MEAARLLGVGFQGDVKKAHVELAPLRWDRSSGDLVLARRLLVRLVFTGEEEGERLRGGSRGRRYRRRRSHENRQAVSRQLLVVREKGLYRVDLEEIFGSRRRLLDAASLRLSRQGEAVAFHIRGPSLYFMSEGASLNPYGREAVYELELGVAGSLMGVDSAAPSGQATTFYWPSLEMEKNIVYQSSLLDAPDLWLWDSLFAPKTKIYSFELSDLAPSGESGSLTLWLQGGSDLEGSPDHHVRVFVNGVLTAEDSWDGMNPRYLTAELLPGLLLEGENQLEVENTGDTGVSYSMVLLDRFAVSYPRLLVAEEGKLEGRFSQSGVAEVCGVGYAAHLLDTTEETPRWLTGAEASERGLQFRAESGRSYMVVSAGAVLAPEVRRPSPSELKNQGNQADYLLVGPRSFLDSARPLLELRTEQGLETLAVPVEEIYQEFGFGEARPEAVRDFLSYAYHNWKAPSPRYVLFLGDATWDFKDYLETGVVNQVPPRIVKTSYIWASSDPSYGAVNGEDELPDLAIGRLPAATVAEAQVMVGKLVAYETGEATVSGSVVLVADNPDRGADFEADAEEIASGLLSSRDKTRIYLGQMGTGATRDAIVDAFDGGASLMSYIGHGGIFLWARENIFNRFQVDSLAPQEQLPLLLTMNCLNGYFTFPYFNSLSEELVKAEGKGAIAAFSPTGLSLNGPAHLYHEAFLSELVSGDHRRLGDALLAAQAAYADTGAFPELLSIYHLFGDPAMELR